MLVPTSSSINVLAMSRCSSTWARVERVSSDQCPSSWPFWSLVRARSNAATESGVATGGGSVATRPHPPLCGPVGDAERVDLPGAVRVQGPADRAAEPDVDLDEGDVVLEGVGD